MVCNSIHYLNIKKFTFLDLQMQQINAATFKRSAYVTDRQANYDWPTL